MMKGTETMWKSRQKIYEEGSDTPYAMYTESFEIAAADAQCAGILPVSFEQNRKQKDGDSTDGDLYKRRQTASSGKIEIQVQKKKNTENRRFTPWDVRQRRFWMRIRANPQMRLPKCGWSAGMTKKI